MVSSDSKTVILNKTIDLGEALSHHSAELAVGLSHLRKGLRVAHGTGANVSLILKKIAVVEKNLCQQLDELDAELCELRKKIAKP